jgi:hypothetical protein
MNTTRVFEGKGQFKGWRFSLKLEGNAYRRTMLKVPGHLYETTDAHGNPYCRVPIMADTVEIQWLGNWVAAGLIAETSPDEPR